MSGAGPVRSTIFSSGYSRLREEPIDQNKNPFESWQEKTLTSLDNTVMKMLEELDAILTSDKDLAKSLGLARQLYSLDKGSVVERIIGLLNLLQPSTSKIFAGVTQAPRELSFDPLMATAKINFSSRTSNCLRYESIDYLGQLVSLTEKQILRIPRFGKKMLGEVKVVLESLYGAHLGMKHSEIDAVLHKHPLHGWLLA